MIYKGTWDDSTDYEIGDLVLYKYNYYLAKIANDDSEPPSSNWKRYTFIQSIAYIIATFMEIDVERVYIYNQDFKIPSIMDLFIVIEYKGSKNFSSNSRFTATEEADSGKEEISVLTSEIFTINVFSKSEEARLRKEEVPMALTSILAQQQQEIFQYQIGYVARNFLNISELEGAGMLNRFAIDIGVNIWRAKDLSVNYYDTFSKEIVVEPTTE